MTRRRHLSDDDVIAMRLLFDAKLATQKTLAELFGMSHTAIHKIVNRQTYQSVRAGSWVK